MHRGGIISSDLLFASRIRGAAADQGWEIDQITDPLLLSHRAIPDWDVAIIDVTAVSMELGRLVQHLRKAVPQCRIIAFGPHVAEDRLEAARREQCDLVLPRGELNKRLPKLFSEQARDALLSDAPNEKNPVEQAVGRFSADRGSGADAR